MASAVAVIPRNEQHHSELSILGYLIRESRPDLASDLLTVCSPERFMHSDTRPVAEAVRTLAERQEVIDLAGLAAVMKSMRTLSGIGGAATLAGIVQEYRDTILTETRLFEVAGHLVNEHSKRKARQEIAAALQAIQAPGADTNEVAGKLRDAAAKLDKGQPSSGKPQGHALTLETSESSSALRYHREPDPIPWVFENYGVRGTPVLISAAGGVGKTWLEMVLAAMLRTGRALLGDDLCPLLEGNTALIFPEDPEIVKHGRIHTMCKAINYGGDGEKHLLAGLFVPDLYGEDMTLVVKGQRGFETTKVFDALMGYIKRCPGIVCVILDPLNLLHGIDVEQDEVAAQFFASRMAYLAKETNTLVIVAHHSTKGETDPAKFDAEKALHMNTVRGTGALVYAFRSVLTMASLPEGFAKKQFGLAEKPAPGEYVAARIAKNNYGPRGRTFFLRKDMDSGMPHPVKSASRKVERIEKNSILAQLIPFIVLEIADQEGRGKQYTKATFANIYHKEWKTLWGEKPTKAVLSSAIERALVDGYLIEVVGENIMKRPTAYLSVGNVSIPQDASLDNADSWLWGGESDEYWNR